MNRLSPTILMIAVLVILLVLFITGAVVAAPSRPAFCDPTDEFLSATPVLYGSPVTITDTPDPFGSKKKETNRDSE